MLALLQEIAERDLAPDRARNLPVTQDYDRYILNCSEDHKCLQLCATVMQTVYPVPVMHVESVCMPYVLRLVLLI